MDFSSGWTGVPKLQIVWRKVSPIFELPFQCLDCVKGQCRGGGCGSFFAGEAGPMSAADCR